MNQLQRIMLFISGLCFMALGICLIIKSNLGSSPISSLPYVLSLNYPLSLGNATLLINLIFVVLQILILMNKFDKLQLLQLPMTFMFTLFIDGFNWVLAGCTPALYAAELFFTFIGSLSLGFGVALQIIANIVMLPGEGIVYAIAAKWRFNFGNTKICCDCFLVLCAVILSLFCTASIEGLREGTLFSAFAVGLIAKFFLKKLSAIGPTGRITLRCFRCEPGKK